MGRLLTSADRRVMTRVLARIPVKVKVKDLPSSIPTSFSAETADLSSQGASLLVRDSLPVSSRISLTLDLAFPLPRLQADAEVVWNYFLPGEKKFNCGVRFLKLRREHRRILDEFTKTKTNFGEMVPQRRKAERREKAERRTRVVPSYAPERRRVKDRRSFDRRTALITRFFQKLTKPILQIFLIFRKRTFQILMV